MQRAQKLIASIAAISIPNTALSAELCSGRGDEIKYSRNFNNIDICRNETVTCDDGYKSGEGYAWVFPKGTISASRESRADSPSQIQNSLKKFVTDKGGLPKHKPQIKWGFFQSSFIDPKGRKLSSFTRIGGFGFELSYTEADQKSSRTIKTPDTFANHALAVNHCEKIGYLPTARTIYYYFPRLVEDNTGPIPFEALMSSYATVKAVPKPKKPFSGF